MKIYSTWKTFINKEHFPPHPLRFMLQVHRVNAPVCRKKLEIWLQHQPGDIELAQHRPQDTH